MKLIKYFNDSHLTITMMHSHREYYFQSHIPFLYSFSSISGPFSDFIQRSTIQSLHALFGEFHVLF